MEENIYKFQSLKQTPKIGDVCELTKKISKIVTSNLKTYISPAVIRNIYQQFRRWRYLNNQLKSELKLESNFVNAFEREVLKYLLERCYWMQYGDTEIVAYLLISTYEVMGDLGKIFDYRNDKFWLYGKKDRQKDEMFIESTFTDRKLAEESITPVDYFMHHANKQHLLFGGKRFAEQCFTAIQIPSRFESQKSLSLPPCSLSFEYTELLYKLLRYGLFINAEPGDSDVGKLLTGIIGVFLNFPKEFTEHSSHLTQEYGIRVRNMGVYILRAVHSIDPNIIMRFQGRRLAKRRVLWKVNEEYLPNLVQRFYRVQDLKHTCRCKIRKILYDSWNLPIGIEILPLPGVLKKYLNLERD